MMPTLVSFVCFLCSWLALSFAGSVMVSDEPTADDPPVRIQRMAAFDHTPFDRILADVVRDERVDYAALRKSHRPELQAYLDRLAAFDPAVVPNDDRLALYLNLYNASMLATAVARLDKDPKWTPAANDWGVFDDKTVRIGGRSISLNQLENEIIRKEFDEPRIHVALVCAAASCPPLIGAAYAPAGLADTLEENMRRFVNDPARNRVDHRAKMLSLSQIFEWYADDFGGRERLASYVGRYVAGEVAGYSVEFLEYDWALNGVARE